MQKYLTKIPEYMPKFDGKYKGLTRVAFFIYNNIEQAQSGSIYCSTGFLVSMPSVINGQIFLYAVTNRHCIQGINPVLRFNKKDGGLHTVQTVESQWHYIDNHYDIAIFPLVLDTNTIDLTHIDTSFFLTEDSVSKEEIDVGEDVFMVGRFVNHDGGSNINKPSMRFGQISIMNANIIHPYAKYPNLMYKENQEAVLLDMRARTGYSGSPVFVYRTQGSIFHENLKNNEPENLSFLTPYHFMRLLGIQWGIAPDEIDQNSNSFSQEIASVNPKNADDLKNMSIVCPAKYILEVLNKKELKENRDNCNAELLKDRDNAIELTSNS